MFQLLYEDILLQFKRRFLCTIGNALKYEISFILEYEI
jgi:hypothetical protein